MGVCQSCQSRPSLQQNDDSEQLQVGATKNAQLDATQECLCSDTMQKEHMTSQVPSASARAGSVQVESGFADGSRNVAIVSTGVDGDTSIQETTQTIDSLNPSLNHLMALWAEHISQIRVSSQPCKTTASKSIDWSVGNSKAYLDASEHMNNPIDLMRFLHARDGDVQKALIIAKKAALWHAAVDPEAIKKDLIAAPISQKVFRWAGWTKCGYPVVAIDAKIWKPSQYSLDSFIRNVMYTVDIAIKRRTGPGVDRGVILFELEFNFESSKPAATRCLLSLATLLQEVYAERFAAFFLLNCNAIFRLAWRWIKILVEKRVEPLVHFVPPDRSREILGKFIDHSVLEARFGGDYSQDYEAIAGEVSLDSPTTSPPAYDANAPDPLRDAVLDT